MSDRGPGEGSGSRPCRRSPAAPGLPPLSAPQRPSAPRSPRCPSVRPTAAAKRRLPQPSAKLSPAGGRLRGQVRARPTPRGTGGWPAGRRRPGGRFPPSPHPFPSPGAPGGRRPRVRVSNTTFPAWQLGSACLGDLKSPSPDLLRVCGHVWQLKPLQRFCRVSGNVCPCLQKLAVLAVVQCPCRLSGAFRTYFFS